MIRALCLLLVMLSVAAPLQADFSAEMSIQNLQLENDEITFDLYLKSTGSDPLFLSDCNYTILFNKSKFSAPQFTFTPAPGKLSDRYSYTTKILENNTLGVDVFPPTVRSTWSRSRFESRIEEIASTGNGSLLGSIRLKTVEQFTGLADIELRTEFPFFTVINSFEDEQPYGSSAAEIEAEAAPELHLGPEYNVVLSNQQLNDTEFSFDLYMQRTDGRPLELADCDLTLMFNDSKFTDPVYSVVSKGDGRLDDEYSYDARVDGNLLKLEIAAPATASQAEYDNKIQVVGSSAPGTRIASMRLTGVNPYTSIIHVKPVWAEDHDASLISRRRNFTPFDKDDDVSAAAEFSVVDPIVRLDLEAPADPVSYCHDENLRVEWNSENVKQVRIELLPEGGGDPVVLAEEHDASPANFEWTVTEHVGRFKLRVSDRANAALLAETPFFDLFGHINISGQPEDFRLCDGESASFSVLVEGRPSPQMQWEERRPGEDWQPLDAANKNSLSLENVDLSYNGREYRLRLIGACETLISAVATLEVGTAPLISELTADQEVCEGDDLSLRAVLDASPAPSAQWQVNAGAGWEDIEGATDDELLLSDITLAQNGFRYRLLLNNICGNLQSDEIGLTVYGIPAVESDPLSQVVCEGADVIFEVEASGVPLPTVQWQVSSDGGFDWDDLPGANSFRLELPAVDRSINQRRYRARFTHFCNESFASRKARLTVNYVPEVLVQPLDVTVCKGEPTVFTTLAEGRPEPDLQWQVRSGAGAEWQELTDETSATLTISETPAALNGNEYRAVFSNICGSNVATHIARLQVNTSPVVEDHPRDVRLCVGESAEFSAVAGGRPEPKVHWEVSFDGGDAWIEVAGADKSTLTIDNVQLSQNDNLYRAVFANVCDGFSPSSPAILNVTKAPEITRHPFSARVIVGEDVTFSVDVDQPNSEFAWYRAEQRLVNSDKITGVVTAILTLSDVQPDDVDNEYYVIVTGECGADTSRFFALNVDVPDIEILTQPEAKSVCEGATLEFSIEAQTEVNGARLVYQWRRGSEDLSNNAVYQGVNSSVLSIKNVSASEANSAYNVRISTDPGNAITFSDNVGLTVRQAPFIIRQPLSIAVCEGRSAALEIAIEEGDTPQYQWFHDGVMIDNANDPRHIVAAVESALTGRYHCRVTNECGSTESREAEISLKTATSILQHPRSTTASSETEFSLEVQAEGEGELRYQWFLNGVAITGATRPVYSRVRPTLADEGEYTVRVRGECGDISSDPASVGITIVGVAEEASAQPFALGSNFPNPFASVTKIPFTLERAASVALHISSALGHLMMELAPGPLPAGRHELAVDGRRLPSGLYHYTLIVDGRRATRRMMILR